MSCLFLTLDGHCRGGGRLALFIKAKYSLGEKKKKLSPSLLPLSSLATQVTYNYIVWTTKRSALHGTNAVRQTGRCLFFLTTWMTGCHKVVGVLVAALSPCRFLQGAVAEQVSISAWLLSGPTEKGCFCHPGAVFLKDCTSCNAFPCIFPAAAFFFSRDTTCRSWCPAPPAIPVSLTLGNRVGRSL